MEKKEETEGGFLLESLGEISALDMTEEDTRARPTLRKKDKESKFFGKDRVIAIDPNRELRELRERQQRFERRIFFLTMMLLVAIATFVLGTQTSLGPKAMVAFRSITGSGKGNVACQVPANYNLPECVARRREMNSDWRGIERGSGTKFSLHGN